MLWLGLLSSRPFSFWMSFVGIPSGAENNLEGNPLDMVFLLGLILAAFLVLRRRGFDWGQFISRNKALILIYLYFALSFTWAEHSFPTIKRVFKDFGHVIVALVFLTEVNVMDVIRMSYVRVCYILFPLSVVFIKYFPEIGRRASRSGDAMFNGVAWHKSSLGAIIFLFGLFVVIDFREEWKVTQGRERRLMAATRLLLLAMGGWLMYTCGSVTSLLCFSLGAFLLWGSARLVRLANPVLIFTRCIVLVGALFIAEKAFDLSGTLLQAVGKSKTLTGRTEIWDMAEQARVPALYGNGFYSFWGSDEAKRIQEHFIEMNSAHNGFLDTYLDGGYIGLSLLILLMLVWGGRSIKRMLSGSLLGRVAFMIWILSIIYNNSETAFFRLDPVWFTLIVMLVDAPPVYHPEKAQRPAELASLESQRA
jgi:exopolysaccharide production protein ExoQ